MGQSLGAASRIQQDAVSADDTVEECGVPSFTVVLLDLGIQAAPFSTTPHPMPTSFHQEIRPRNDS